MGWPSAEMNSLSADIVLCGQYVLCNIEPLLRDNSSRKLPLIQEINTVHMQGVFALCIIDIEQ